MPGGGGAERRRARRVRYRLSVAYEDGERQLFLHSRDLSERGVFLHSSEAPPLGERAQILLEIPGDQAFVRLHGRVTRVSDREPAGFAVDWDPEGLPERQGAPLRAFLAEEARSTAG